jgi:hypothetical protein
LIAATADAEPIATMQEVEDAGAGYVLSRVDIGWRLVGSDTRAGNDFGTHVAIDGDWMIVSEPGAQTVYFFERTADGWIERDSVDLGKPIYGVAIQGDVAAVSSSAAFNPPTVDSLAVVLERVGPTDWQVVIQPWRPGGGACEGVAVHNGPGGVVVAAGRPNEPGQQTVILAVKSAGTWAVSFVNAPAGVVAGEGFGTLGRLRQRSPLRRYPRRRCRRRRRPRLHRLRVELDLRHEDPGHQQRRRPVGHRVAAQAGVLIAAGPRSRRHRQHRRLPCLRREPDRRGRLFRPSPVRSSTSASAKTASISTMAPS